MLSDFAYCVHGSRSDDVMLNGGMAENASQVWGETHEALLTNGDNYQS